MIRAADPAPPEALKEVPNDPMMVGQVLLPRGVPETSGGLRRTDDVGHQHREDAAGVGRSDREVRAVSRQVDEDERLVARGPGVVPRWQVHDLVRPELVLLAVLHLDTETPRQNEL